MKTRVLLATTAAALALGGVASAQVTPVAPPSLPNTSVTATPRVTPPAPLGDSAASQAGATVRSPQAPAAADTAKAGVDAVRSTGAAATRDASVNASASANADARVAVNRDRNAVNAAIQGGAEVRSSDGVRLGTVAEISRNPTGRVMSFVVRSTDGALRTVPIGQVGVQGDALVTGWTQSQFMARQARTGSSRN
jgi:hypothetical protein